MNRPAVSPVDPPAPTSDGDFQSRFAKLGELAKSDVAAEPFFEELIRSIVADFPQSLAFAAVWHRAASARTPISSRLILAFGTPSPSWDSERQLVDAELRPRADVSRADIPQGDAGRTIGSTTSGPKTHVVCLTPQADASANLDSNGRSRPGWLAVIRTERGSDEAYAIHLRLDQPPGSMHPGGPETAFGGAEVRDDDIPQLLSAYGFAVEDFVLHHQLARFRGELQTERMWKEMLASIHQSLDVNTVAREIVAAAVSLTHCRRAILTLSRQPAAAADKPNDPRFRQRVVAVSGVATLDHRSPLVRSIARLSRGVAVFGDRVVVDSDLSDSGKSDSATLTELPPQISEDVEAYVDLAHCHGLVAVPMIGRTIEERSDADRQQTSGRVLGVLTLECHGPAQADQIAAVATELAFRSATALRLAVEYDRIPFRRWGSRFAGVMTASPFAGIPASVWVIASLCLFAAVLIWFPATLEVHCTGTLQPATVAGCFAPRDGEITEILIRHDEAVRAGQRMLSMDSPDLELQLRKIQGTINATEEELQAAEAARRQNRPANSARGNSGDAFGNNTSLAADEARLMATLENYRSQQQLLLEERDRLSIVSPIDGKVITWDVRGSLQNRPVRRGQQLLEIAAQSSPWILSLELPDRVVGHVIEATGQSDRPLELHYAIVSEPGKSYSGVIDEIAWIATRDENQSVVEVTAKLIEPLPDSLRAGLRVRAEIRCGSTSLGYAWFHEFIDTLRFHLSF